MVFAAPAGEQKEAMGVHQPSRGIGLSSSENAINGSNAKPKMGIRHMPSAAPLRVAPITTLTLDF